MDVECPRCHLTFNPEVKPVINRLAAWHSGHHEPAPETPVDDGFAPVGFADPPTSAGGQAHLTIGDASTGTRPVKLTVVFVAANSVAEADRTPEILLGHPEYPQDGIDIPPDSDLTSVSVKVGGVTPGDWDVGVIASYPDA